MDNSPEYTESSSSSKKPPYTDYPVQQHAGKVGYGPNYNADAGIVDKVEGLTEEIVGKVTHNPKLIHKGHELHTGELKRRELLGETDPAKDPFFGQDLQTTKATSEAHSTKKAAATVADRRAHQSNAGSRTVNEAALN
ncbi:hypothetical protein BDN70DRAFT_664111 [Pholiota conissans]|uniref:Uncharacterized protein n=1 Tax=Pholiota conissans TaxID=109636 RepID=A0A9P5Z3Y9_9AGAR|nr:hypothetical protein BDN70DRAFT_664111 [Pholiota conissans]